MRLILLAEDIVTPEALEASLRKIDGVLLLFGIAVAGLGILKDSRGVLVSWDPSKAVPGRPFAEVPREPLLAIMRSRLPCGFSGR
jgi:hypothetical protein